MITLTIILARDAKCKPTARLQLIPEPMHLKGDQSVWWLYCRRAHHHITDRVRVVVAGPSTTRGVSGWSPARCCTSLAFAAWPSSASSASICKSALAGFGGGAPKRAWSEPSPSLDGRRLPLRGFERASGARTGDVMSSCTPFAPVGTLREEASLLCCITDFLL